MQLAQKHETHTVVFTWQNLNRFYPPPFHWMERYVLRHADALLVGNLEAQAVWRAKGYNGMIRQIPQFGVDPTIFYRRQIVKRASRPSVVLTRSARRPSQPALTIGYVGRLVREKGIDFLLQAASKLTGPWSIKILGEGPDRKRLERMAQWLGIGSRVTFDEKLPSMHVPNYLSGLDVLVLPSITRPNWKEQFGRVLMEAMACDVVTVGARSGAIPEVIDQAGMLFKEGDSEELRECLQSLINDVPLREELRQAGKQRVLDHYTHAAIAQRTVDIYRLIV
jgi:glycosyltransferase involved in cell wall biosynthesis